MSKRSDYGASRKTLLTGQPEQPSEQEWERVVGAAVGLMVLLNDHSVDVPAWFTDAADAALTRKRAGAFDFADLQELEQLCREILLCIAEASDKAHRSPLTLLEVILETEQARRPIPEWVHHELAGMAARHLARDSVDFNQELGGKGAERELSELEQRRRSSA